MKNIKTVVKQLALIFVVFLSLYNCQNDDAVILDSKVTLQQSAITKSVSASEIPKVMQFLRSKSNSRLEFLVDDSNTELGMYRSHEENLSMTTALTEQIKMVTNSYGKSNYTFELIEQGDKSGVYFINLVVKEYRDELYMYIIKYVPDATWLQTHHITRDFNDFTGYLYFYSEDGTYVGKTTMANGMATSSFQKHPCEGETGETETTDNSSSSSSSNSGTGGGGAIGSDCYVYLEWYECNGDNSDEEHSSEECGGSSGTGSGWTLVIICEEGIRSMRDTLRHPCDGGSTIGGGTNTNTPSCETITGTSCNDMGEILMEWDDNCNCIESQTIENSEVVVVNTDKERCKVFNGLENDDSFKIVMQDLKNKASTDNKETLYIMESSTDLGENYTYFGPYEGAENTLGIDGLNFDEDYQCAAIAHNHYEDANNMDLSVHSPHDLYTLYLLLKNNHMENTGTFFSFVVTNHGTTYALGVSNPQAFIAFGDLVFVGWETIDKNDDAKYISQEYFGTDSSTQTYPNGINHDNTVEENELNLMKILNYPGIEVGLELYKADENFENWQQLKLDNNQINYLDCNNN